MKKILLITIFILTFCLLPKIVKAGVIFKPVFHTGLVGYWDLQEGAGTKAYDKSGYDNDGDLTSMEENDWVDGKIGKALSFDGSSEYVEISSAELPTKGPMTISAWVNMNSFSADTEALLSRWSDGNFAFEFQAYPWSPGSFHFLGVTGGTRVRSASYTTAQTGQWYHLVGVADANNVYLYVNGVKYSDVDGGWNAGTATGFTRIGMRPDGALPSNDTVDEVRVYNRALSESEIQRIYKLSQPKVLAPPSNGLVGYWPFEENTGTKAGDHSGNGNNGDLTNMEESDWVDGKIGKALDFDGSNEYVGKTNPSWDFTANPTNTFSLSAWFKPDACVDLSGVELSLATAGSLRLFCRTTGAYWGFQIQSGTAYSVSANNTCVIGQWQHLVGVYDAGVTRTGSVTKIQNSNQTDSQSVTVPTDAELAVFMATGWDNLWNSGPTTLSLGGNSFTVEQETDGDSHGNGNVIIAYLANPPTGSQTLSWSWKSAVTEGVNMAVVFYKNVNTSSPITDSGEQITAGTDLTGLTVNSGDMMVGVVYSYDTAMTVTDNGQTELANLGRYNNCYGAFAEKSEGTGFYFTGNNYNTVAAIVIATNATAKIYLYYNGIQVDSDTPGTDTSAVSDGLAIGNAQAYFNGAIDEVRVYNRALETSEITALYKSGLAKINTSQNDQLTNGLVGLWSFNGPDIDGNEAYDRSGNGNHGNITGAVPAIGKVGQALNFDGSDDYVYAPDSSSLDIGGDKFTISLWFKANSLPGPSSSVKLVFKEDSVLSAYDFSLGNFDGAGVQLYVNARNTSDVNVTRESTTAESFSTGIWYHVVGVLPGAGSNLLVYINGVDKSQWSSGTFSGTLKNADWRLNIGGPYVFFNGLIDEVRIYNRALTAQEILRLYNMGH